MTTPAEAPARAVPRILTGNQAAAWGAFLSRVEVVSAYPITPQTTVIETLADLMGRAEWPSRFVNVESEHSAMSVCIGASYAGSRTFTATSSQGLALMHELLHWAGGGRLPIVLVNVNRAMAPGWSIWTDQQDSLSQRDTGWAQFYCSGVQDVLDHVILGFRLAEEASVPVMIVEDAFVLSHTAEAVDLPSPEVVARFLPPRTPLFRLDVERPQAFGGLLGPDVYQEVRRELHEAVKGLESSAPRAYAEWERLTGRSYAPVETFHLEGAEVVLLTSGAVSSTAREVVETLRARRQRVGLVQVRMFRPFPGALLREALRGVPRVAVVDRNCSFGHHGIFFQELKSALYGMDAADRPLLYGYVMGLGGRDIGPRALQEVVHRTAQRARPDPETLWLGSVLPETRERGGAGAPAPAGPTGKEDRP